MRIGIYTNSDTLQIEDSSTRYLYEALRSPFDVTLYSERDAGLCEGDDVVFCRFRRPLDLEFVASLKRYRDKLIINDPTAQLLYQSKRNLLPFPDLTPPTAVLDSTANGLRWVRDFDAVVLKPIDGHRGEGIVRVDVHGVAEAELRHEIEKVLSRNGGTVLAQQYIHGVEELGDKRINVFGFEPISAIVRYPPPGSFICNIACGGTAEPADITEADRKILDRVIPFLAEQGLWWAAIDVIGPYLTELNIATPCAIWDADVAHGDERGSEAFVARLSEFQRRHGL
jgi:glutathione synthase